DQTGGIDQSELHNSIDSHPSAAKNNGRPLQAAQDPPPHGTKPERSRFHLWLKKAAKSIQVVTKDAGSIAGKLMNEMGVTVVADMKTVEIVSLLVEETSVIPKSSQKSIGIPSAPPPAKPRHMLEASSHAGPNAFGVHLARRLRLHEKHIGHQIHACPVLL